MRQAELAAADRRRKRTRQSITGVVVVLAVAGLGVLLTRGGGTKTNVASGKTTTTAAAQSSTTAPPSTTPATSAAPPPTSAACAASFPNIDGSSPTKTKFSAAPPLCINVAKTYVAHLTTDVGAFDVTFDAKLAPKTVNNFVFLALNHFYDGVVFHRVIPGFVVQGGDPTGTGTGGPGYQFADELPPSGAYKIGSLAMANSGPNTNGSQFFIITGDQGTQLPPQYSLFGQVTTGMDVVKKIESDGAASGTPKVIHKMLKVTITAS
jgi:cyclophilin family peptidyl-prolyl cis-trans isomerase